MLRFIVTNFKERHEKMKQVLHFPANISVFPEAKMLIFEYLNFHKDCSETRNSQSWIKGN